MAEPHEDFAVHRLIRDLFDDLSLTLPSLGCAFEGLVTPNALTARGASQTLRNKLFLLFADLSTGNARLTVRFLPARVGDDLVFEFVCTPFIEHPERLPRWEEPLFRRLEGDAGFQITLPAGKPLELGPPLNWQKLNQTYGGEAQGRQVLDLFLSRCGPLLDQLDHNLQAHDAQGVLKAAHTLKGSARGVGALALAEAALQLEMVGRAGVLTGADDLYKALQVTYDELIVWVGEGQR